MAIVRADCYTFSDCEGLLNVVINPILTSFLEKLWHKDDGYGIVLWLCFSQPTCLKFRTGLHVETYDFVYQTERRAEILIRKVPGLNPESAYPLQGVFMVFLSTLM